jgi:kynurenine formamidase
MYLVESGNFKAYGTSWKSTDFQPGKRERPIHKIFLSRQITIFECLNLSSVAAGEYILFGFPLPMKGATESPVCPLLFTFEELDQLIRT